MEAARGLQFPLIHSVRDPILFYSRFHSRLASRAPSFPLHYPSGPHRGPPPSLSTILLGLIAATRAIIRPFAPFLSSGASARAPSTLRPAPPAHPRSLFSLFSRAGAIRAFRSLVYVAPPRFLPEIASVRANFSIEIPALLPAALACPFFLLLPLEIPSRICLAHYPFGIELPAITRALYLRIPGPRVQTDLFN